MSFRGQDRGWAGRGGGAGRGYQGRGGRGGGSHGRGDGGGPPRNIVRVQRIPVTVQTNCFEITRLPQKQYYLYDILFSPEMKRFEGRQAIMHKLQAVVLPNVFNPRALYDGNALLYSSHALNLESGGSGTYDVDLSDSGRPVVRGTRGVYSVYVKLTSGDPIRPSDLDAVLAGGTSTPKSIVATNLLQLLIRQEPNQNYPHNARAYFTDVQKKSLGEGLELWRGYFQSVRPNIGRMLINIDTTMATVYKKGPLIQVLLEFLGSNDVRDLDLRPNSAEYRKLEKFVDKLKIFVDTPGSKGAMGVTKTIRGLASNAGNFSFQDKKGKDWTVASYLQTAYNITIRHKTIVGIRLTSRNADNPSIIPLEICRVKPGQFYKQRLPDHFTKDVVAFSTLKPEHRLETIMGKGSERMLPSPIKGFLDSEFMREAMMQVAPEPIRIRGELLALPKVVFDRNSNADMKNGSWNVAGQRFIRPASLIVWGVINFATREVSDNLARKLMNDMENCCRTQGENTASPLFFIKGADHAPEQALNTAQISLIDAYGKLDPQRVKQLQARNLPSVRPIIIVLLPKLAQELRRKIKHWSDITTGIPTQCLMDDKIKSAKIQYWGNIAVKLNARLGGRNSQVDSPAMTKLQEKRTIVMGTDVSHPAANVQKPSIASLVASYDALASRYMAFMRVQMPRLEVIQDLSEMVADAVNNFGEMNKAAPDRIILFRDGISEGEFDTVSRQEISAIRDGIKLVWKSQGLNPNNMPKLSYIIVGKRHHVTFFPESGSVANDGRGNCVAGFVNDMEDFSNPITEDFYLQSHGAIQGTSRSGHYTVMLDEIYDHNLKDIQDLAFSLCHVYAKATRSVSIPAPVYYADIACARGPIHFEEDSELNLASETASISSGQQSFDLRLWSEAFKQVNQRAAREMYFL
ncbi:Piwi-domain-containing protein [Gymnopus androsaceus JB14]|uniref:Piwi-domain-containing protein n=1 Tax=Gymnopus androsaceus JB14 TaxID=1447944 RepID=A0A6A4IAF5_9AGAR|nr:Piwi-domain-containing protein [Gymnopus androsaceus JB14]